MSKQFEDYRQGWIDGAACRPTQIDRSDDWLRGWFDGQYAFQSWMDEERESMRHQKLRQASRPRAERQARLA